MVGDFVRDASLKLVPRNNNVSYSDFLGGFVAQNCGN